MLSIRLIFIAGCIAAIPWPAHADPIPKQCRKYLHSGDASLPQCLFDDLKRRDEKAKAESERAKAESERAKAESERAKATIKEEEALSACISKLLQYKDRNPAGFVELKGSATITRENACEFSMKIP